MSEPIAIVNVTPDLQYALTDTGALYRNDQQVIIPIPDAEDLMHELRHVLEMLRTLPTEGERKPAEVEEVQEGARTAAMCNTEHRPTGERCYRRAGHDGSHETDRSGDPDSIAWSWSSDQPTSAGNGTVDLTWKGFEIRGYIESGQARAEVQHPESEESLNLYWGSAEDIMAVEDSSAYEILCAKAFFTWWDRNGFSESHKAGHPEAPTVPKLPEWEPGTTVKHRYMEGTYGVVWKDPAREGMRSLMVNNGDRIRIIGGNESILSDYEEI